jgi:hypothetical protein
MDNPIAYLKGEISRIQKKRDAELARIQKKRDAELTRIQTERDADLAPFEAALAAALKTVSSRNGHYTKTGQASVAKRSAKGAKQKRAKGVAAYGAKIAFVLKAVEKHAKNGLSPAEIREMSPREWTAGGSYPYTQLYKLNEQEQIVVQDGKYFPNTKGEQI